MEESTWQVVVLIPKRRGEYRVIGLVDLVWKVAMMTINRRLRTAISFHDVLHILQAGCCTGTASLNAKLLQKLTSTREYVLYNIFLDLHKAYDALDREICLEILDGYGVVPQACRLLHTYWDQLKMVACGGRYYGTAFKGFRGATQGD